MYVVIKDEKKEGKGLSKKGKEKRTQTRKSRREEQRENSVFLSALFLELSLISRQKRSSQNNY